MTASTSGELVGQVDRAGRSGSSNVPAVAPSWPIATIASAPLSLSVDHLALTAGTIGSRPGTGPRLPGKMSVGPSSLEKPTTPILTPWNVERLATATTPAASSRRRRRCSPTAIGKCASGIRVSRRYACALVEVVVAERVGVEAHQVHDLDASACRRRSRDRRRRADGVAAAIVIEPSALRRGTRRTTA